MSLLPDVNRAVSEGHQVPGHLQLESGSLSLPTKVIVNFLAIDKTLTSHQKMDPEIIRLCCLLLHYTIDAFF